MRVLMITNMYPSAGNPVFGVFVHRQVAALRASGLDVRLVANTDDRGGSKALGKYLSLLVRTMFASLVGHPDIVVGHFLYPTAWLARIAALVARAPYVVVAHGTDATSAAGSDRIARFSRKGLLDADAVVAVSASLMSRLHEELDLPSGTTARVIHMGVDGATFHPDAGARARLGWSPEERIILYVGNLVPVKGPDVLLDAFASIREAVPASRFVLVGDGPMRQDLAARAESTVPGAVTFAGRLGSTDVAAYMAAADVVVMPSRAEGLGLVALEAFACGTPVVASRVGGLPEVFSEDCGTLVEPESPQALSDAVVEILLSGKEVYAEQCVAVAEKHDVRVKAREFAEFLEEVCDVCR